MPIKPPADPLAPLRNPGWLSEAQRKALHIAFILLPLEILHEWLPWPRGRGEWRLVLIGMVVIAVIVDVVRIHDRRARQVFARLFGPLIRKHEAFNLLGSTYLLLAALLAVELFSRPIAAAALGFTVLGDGFAAVIGRAYGRRRFFGKSLEGTLGCLVACLAWAAYLAWGGHLPAGVVIFGALAASLIELLPIPLDDNLAITLFAGYVMKLLVSPT